MYRILGALQLIDMDHGTKNVSIVFAARMGRDLGSFDARNGCSFIVVTKLYGFDFCRAVAGCRLKLWRLSGMVLLHWDLMVFL